MSLEMENVNRDAVLALGAYAAAEFEKGWMLAEELWYCRNCGFVSETDVQINQDCPDSGTCRCGELIELTAF